MKLDIMGLQFDNVTMDEAAARAEKILAGEKTCYVVTPNAEIAYEALHDEKLRALINDADLVLPDGAGVVLASKLLKTPLKQKVAGVDFADRLLSVLEKTGGGLFLLGSKPGIAELAAQKMTGKHPKLRICGMNDGCNLEWLYRLIKEPKRFGRMLRLPKYLFAVLGKRIRG